MNCLRLTHIARWLPAAARMLVIWAALVAAPCLGATYTWNVADGNWNNAGNWLGGLPPSSNTTDLLFPNDPSATYTSTNDFSSGRVIEKIILTGGATTATGSNVIAGSLVDVRNSANSITNSNSDAVGWDLQLDLGFYPPGYQLILDGTGTTPALISGNILKAPAANSTPGRGIKKEGATTWIVSGNIESTIDGPITVDAGMLDLQGTANAFTGDVIVNGGVLRATGTSPDLLGTGASHLYLNGGTLELYTDESTAVDYGRDITVTGDAGIRLGRTTPGGGNALNRQFGALSIGNAKLTASMDTTNYTDSRVDRAYLTFDSTTLTGDAEIDVYEMRKSTTYRYLTLGGISDGGGGHDLTVRSTWFYGKTYVTGVPAIGGDLTLNGGTMFLENGADSTLSTVGGNITLNTGGVLGLTGDFTRPLGDGPGQIQLTGSSYNGFTVNGTNHVKVTLTDPATGQPAALKWNTGYFNTTGLSLAIHGTPGGSSLELVNSIDLNGANRRFMNYNGVNTLSGRISNSGASSAGIYTNTNTAATLYLTDNQNSFDGTISFSGTLRFDSIADADGTPSALGAPTSVANSLISLGNRHYKGILLYTGSGDSSTDRMIRLASQTGPCGITANGAGTISFTNTDPMPTPEAGVKTFTLNGTNTGDNTFAIGIIDNSPTNTTSLVKSGAGKWILSGANTYSGSTSVNAGTLLANGTHTGGGDYTVAAGATFGGNGVIDNSANIDLDGILAPGASIGTLTAGGDLITNNGASYQWELGDGTHDLMAVGGDLTINDTLSIVLLDGGASLVTQTDTLDLFTYGGALSLGNVVIDDQFVAGLTHWDTSNATIGFDGDSVFITGLEVVPEPSTCLLAALGLIGLGFIRRRRRTY